MVEVVSTELPRFITVLVVAMVPARFKRELLVAVRPPAKVSTSVVWSPKVVIPVLFRVVAPLILPPERTLRLYAPVEVMRLAEFNVPLKATSLPEVVPLILTAPAVTAWLKEAPPLLVIVTPPDILMTPFEVMTPFDPESRVRRAVPEIGLAARKSISAPLGELTVVVTCPPEPPTTVTPLKVIDLPSEETTLLRLIFPVAVFGLTKFKVASEVAATELEILSSPLVVNM